MAVINLPICLTAEPSSIRDQIRIRVCSELEPMPLGSFDDSDDTVAESDYAIEIEPSDNLPNPEDGRNADPATDELWPYRYAINQIKKISPYMISGMLYGWSFEYTPSDKVRGVKEYFDFELIEPFDRQFNRITMHYPYVDGSDLVAWAWCDRNSYQKDLYDHWVSLDNPKITGRGSASITKGFEGIKEACGIAIKNAVRDYYRQTIKDKPKEISGKVLLIKEPRIYIKNGEYSVELDFFMENDRIILYTFY